jgi:4-nitrophenyl phosphatase
MPEFGIQHDKGLAMNLANIAGAILDGDGVLWRGSMPLPGLQDFFAFLRERNLPFILATNNSASAPAAYVTKLAGMGVTGVEESQIVTSGTATVDYMKPRYPAGTRVHVLGGDGLRQIMGEAGYELVEAEAQVVVAGMDFNVTYDKLKRATLLIRAGADFIGTNGDRSFPTPEGLCPGSGSLLALLEVATDQKPNVIGKPNAPMFESSMRILGTTVEQTLMVGDRLETDILGANQVGMPTAMMMTGVTSQEQLAASDIKPTGVFADLPALIVAWK